MPQSSWQELLSRESDAGPAAQIVAATYRVAHMTRRRLPVRGWHPPSCGQADWTRPQHPRSPRSAGRGRHEGRRRPPSFPMMTLLFLLLEYP